MADRITLTLEPRKTLGKKVKRLRRAGIIPVHLYGPGIEPRSLQIQGPELVRVLTQAGGNTPISITVGGEPEEYLAFAREIQWDPVRGTLVHVDFLRAEATQRMTAEVPVILEGDSPGARTVFGTVVQQLRSVTVEALPMDMPRDIILDLSVMTEPDSVIRVGDITLPAGATPITDPEAMIARIEVARAEEAVEGAAEPLAEGQAEEGVRAGVTPVQTGDIGAGYCTWST